MWANLVFLFMLSLFPVFTDWLGKTVFAHLPMVVYIILMIGTSMSYFLLQRMVKNQSNCTEVQENFRPGYKEYGTLVLELLGLAASFIFQISWIPMLFLIPIAPLWIIPDLRIVKLVNNKKE